MFFVIFVFLIFCIRMRLFRENRTKNKIVRREKRTEDDEPGQEDKDYRGRTTTNQDKRTKTHTTEDDEAL